MRMARTATMAVRAATIDVTAAMTTTSCAHCCSMMVALGESVVIPSPPLIPSTILLMTEVMMMIALLPVATAWSRPSTMMRTRAHRLVAHPCSESRLTL